jgi:hypothetical protein
MNEVEAKEILGAELSRYRRRSYTELLSLVDRSETFERVSRSGVTYQLEMQVFVDDESRRTLRVMGAIDDGGWRALKPLCADFIVASDGSFVGE